MGEPTSRLVTTRSLRFHVREAGAGEPVLFLHGFPQDSWMWRGQLAALSDGWQCIAADTRGFGGTDKPRQRVTRQLLVRDIVDLLDALDIEQVSLVGHDWGGIIASAVALQQPRRVRRLALIDTLCTTWVPWAVHGWWFKDEPRAEVLFERHGRAFIEALFAGVPPAYGGWPDVPWLPPSPWFDPGAHWSNDDVEHYAAAFDDPGTRFNAISYYRDALPFHREGAHVSNMQVAAEWNAAPSTPRSPNQAWFPDFAPEDRHLTYAGPTMLLFSRYLVPGAFAGVAHGELPSDGAFPPPGSPGADAFTASFTRHFPTMQARAAVTGHFIPEEDPARTEQCLREWLGWDEVSPRSGP